MGRAYGANRADEEQEEGTRGQAYREVPRCGRKVGEVLAAFEHGQRCQQAGESGTPTPERPVIR